MGFKLDLNFFRPAKEGELLSELVGFKQFGKDINEIVRKSLLSELVGFKHNFHLHITVLNRTFI